MAEKITLKNNMQSVDLEVKDASVGPSVIDLKSLYNDTGYFTFDPSYSTTASCESKITYIDGAKGILEYRGYPIDVLISLLVLFLVSNKIYHLHHNT